MNSTEKKLKDNGWFWSETFHHYQKVNNAIYVYVRPQMFGRWIAQAYLRGTTGMCSLEARVEENQEIMRLFDLGDRWLDTYGADATKIVEDPYNPFNRNGWSGENIVGKELAYEKESR